MKLTVRLHLPKAYNKIIVSYNTYEKVPYDKYFVASIVKNISNRSDVYDFIDEITGKGSLNEHFKKLYDDIKSFSKDDISLILTNSIYPVVKISEYYYQYIPMLNISIFNGNVLQGNIADNDLFARTLVDKNGTYVSHEFIENEPISRPDIYKVNFISDNIKVEISNKLYDIDENDFNRIVEREDMDLENYKGTISKVVDGISWNQLTKAAYNNIMSSKDFYYENGNHFAIFNDFVRESIIARSWGLLWVNEKNHRYNDAKNSDICEKVSNVLMKSGKINEFKTKSLVDILKNVGRDLQQEIINYVLKRKDSKELSLIGLVLIDKGYEKGWNEEALKSFYKFRENSKQLINLYRINQNYEYKIDDFIEIYKNDKTLLQKEHLDEVNRYYNDCDELIKSMQKKVGEISLSGIRQNLGKMTLDKEIKEFKRYTNDILAHFDKNIKDKNLQQLKQFEYRVNEFYNLFKIVQKKWELYNSKE